MRLAAAFSYNTYKSLLQPQKPPIYIHAGHGWNRLGIRTYKLGNLLRWTFRFEIASVHITDTASISTTMEIPIGSTSLFFFLIALTPVIASLPTSLPDVTQRGMTYLGRSGSNS